MRRVSFVARVLTNFMVSLTQLISVNLFLTRQFWLGDRNYLEPHVFVMPIVKGIILWGAIVC